MDLPHSQGLPQTAIELRDRILAFLVSDPAPASACIRRSLDSAAGRRSVAAFCELLGREYSRRILDGLTVEEWNRIDQTSVALHGPVQASDLSELHRALLWERLGWEGAKPKRDPFAFVDSLDAALRARLFQAVTPSRLALLSVFWNPARMSGILDALPESVRRQAVLEIALQQKLPTEALKAAALGFADELARAAAGPVPPVFRGESPKKTHHEARDPLVQSLRDLQASRAHERQLLEFITEEGGSEISSAFLQAEAELESELDSGEGLPASAYVLESSGNA